MGLFDPAGINDYRTQDGRVIRLPDAVGSYLGLPKYTPTATELGADPTAWGRSRAPGEGVIPPITPVKGDNGTGTYETDDNSDTSGEVPIQQPSAPVAQAAPHGMSLGARPRPGVANIAQQGPTDITALQGAGNTAGRDASFSKDELAAINAGQSPVGAGQPAAPYTEDSLRKTGIAGALNQQQAALADEGKAIDAEAAKREAALQKQAAVQAEVENRVDERVAARAKEINDYNQKIADATASANAAVQKYADFKTDTSVDHPILAAISVALGAAGGVIKNDGTNPALDMLLKQMERKVNLQMAERDRLGTVAQLKRGQIDLVRQQLSDRTAQHNLAIAGEIERGARKVEAIGTQLNSELARTNAAKLAAELRQKGADLTTAAVMAQAAADEREKARQEQMRHTKVEEQLARGQLGVAQGHLALANKQFDWQKEYQQKDLDLKAQEIAAKKGVDSAKEYRELGVAAPPRSKVDKDGNVSVERGGVLTNADGTPFTAPTKEEAIEMRKKVGAANNLVAVMDEIRAIRDRVGGESSWNNSNDYQRLQVLKNNLVLLKKAGTQGMSSDEDMNKLIASLGASDPASFRSQMAGLDEGRNQIVKQLNSDLHTQYGYTGADLDWADPVKAAKPQTDEQFKSLLSDPMDVAMHDADAEQKLIKDLGVDQTKEWQKNTPSGRVTLLRNALDAAGDMSPSQRQILDTYASALSDPNVGKQERDRALEYLTTASTTSKSKGVKSYATQILAGQATAGAQTTPETIDEPATSTARDASYGGVANTMTEQKQNEAIVQNLPLDTVARGAFAGDRQMINELHRRGTAPNADRATRKLLHDYIVTRK